MTAEELAAIEARADAATTGPWQPKTTETHPGFWTVEATGVMEFVGEDTVFAWDIEGDMDENGDGVAVLHGEIGDGQYKPQDADLAFIAHARTDIPALVAEVRRLMARLDAARCAAVTLHESGDCGQMLKHLVEVMSGDQQP